MATKKTKAQPVNSRQIDAFLKSAAKKLEAARKALDIDAEAAYEIAYEGIVKGSLTLMLSYGERPRSQPGHHVVISEYCRSRLGKAYGPLLDVVDRMRRKRNQAFYDLGNITRKEAEDAVATAEKYLGVIEAEIAQRLKPHGR